MRIYLIGKNVSSKVGKQDIKKYGKIIIIIIIVIKTIIIITIY